MTRLSAATSCDLVTLSDLNESDRHFINEHLISSSERLICDPKDE